MLIRTPVDHGDWLWEQIFTGTYFDVWSALYRKRYAYGKRSMHRKHDVVFFNSWRHTIICGMITACTASVDGSFLWSFVPAH